MPKPKLAKLNEDYPKLKDLNDAKTVELTINYLLVLLNIKTSSEEDKNNLYQQMAVIWDIIKTKFPTITTEEIKEAFKMYVAGEFHQIKVFRNILDAILICEVLNAYTEFRNESLRTYEFKKKAILSLPPPVSELEKKQTRDKFIEILFEELKKQDYYESAWLLYDDLYASGKIQITEGGKKNLYNEQLLKYKTEKQNEIAKKGSLFSISAKNELKSIIDKGDKIKVVQNRCKSILVCEVLKPITNLDLESFKKFIYEPKM